MSPLIKFWGMVQGDPVFMRKVNGWLTIFWIIMIPVSFLMGWLQSVIFVSALSLWALVSGHWSAWQAARVEVKQAEQEKHDLAGEIAKRTIEESNLKRSRAVKKTRHTAKKASA